MNIQEIFDNFLNNTVNLNKNRVDRIKDAQRVLSDFIKNQDEFKNLYIDTVPQGSFRQKTIIKPIGKDGTFDVDLLIKLTENPDWSPKDYNTQLASVFKESGRYKDITDTYGKTRCVTIDYEGEFHVDLVPVVESAGHYYICNKSTDRFEMTDGDGYAQWFEQQDNAANGYLIPVIRLLKYLRETKGDFDTKSIILTTIAGMQILLGDNFSNIPEALSAILVRMNEFLVQFDRAPSIANPAMPGENFDRHWKNDGQGFNRLKSAMGIYADMAADAMSATDTENMVNRWRELFGEKFSNGEEGATMTSNQIAFTTAAHTASRSFTPPRPYADGE